MLGVPVVAQDKAAEPPQALVTFYSTGSFWKNGIPGYKHGNFVGLIFDEYDELAFIRPGHFITFKLDAGQHTFSANNWMIRSPKGGGHLQVDLLAGQHYYVATFFSQAAVVMPLPLLEKRICEDAQKDAAKSTPLDSSQLKKYGTPRAVDETSFPGCQTVPPSSQP
jgi:hypothetical protein